MTQLADFFRYGLCKDPNCKVVHITLHKDKDGDASFAQMTIDIDTLPTVIKALQGFAYELTVERGKE